MHVAIRSLAVTGATAACVATAVLPTITPTPAELLAQTLYMRGTKIGGDADTSNLEYATTTNRFIRYTACQGVDCDYLIDVSGPVNPDPEPVDYPAEFWPITGGLDGPTYGESVQTGLDNLSQAVVDADDDDILVYGYSQSAVIASLYIREHPEQDITYVLLANPMRPNGGILQRFYGLGTIPILDVPLSGATPTGGGEDDNFTVYDITRQYDGWADFPNNPANPLATANAIMGIIYLHGRYDELTPDDIATGDSWTYGDTTYYTIDTPILPLLRPLQDLGVPVAVLAGFDAPLRVLVEAGYDRSLNPGVPATANIFLGPDPITLGIRFVSAIPVGIDDGIELTNGTRPLGTEAAGMYGVGVPENDPVATTALPDTETQRSAQDAPPQEVPLQEVPLHQAEELDPSGDDLADTEPTQAPSTTYLSPGRKRLQELARNAFGAPAERDRPLSHFVNRVLGHDNETEDADDEDTDGVESATQDENPGPSAEGAPSGTATTAA